MATEILELTKFIGKGATRICFEHPENPNLCVKVSVRYKDNYLLEREIEAYEKIRPYLEEFILNYEGQLVETSLGKGLVCEFLRDADGSKSKTLEYYNDINGIDDNLKKQIKEFAKLLLRNNLIFYDFNLENFLVQITSDSNKKLCYADLKSFERYKPWTFLGLERVCRPLAKFLMKKRLERLFRVLKINI